MALKVIGTIEDEEEIPERKQVTPSRMRLVGTIGDEEPLETSRPSKMRLVGTIGKEADELRYQEPQEEPKKEYKDIPMSIGDMMGIVAGGGVPWTPEMSDAIIKEKGQVFVDGMSHGNANLVLYYHSKGKYGLKPSETEYDSPEDGAIHLLGNMAGGDIITLTAGGALSAGPMSAAGAIGLNSGVKYLYERLIQEELVNDYDEFKDVIANKGASVLSAARDKELNLMGEMTGGFIMPPDERIADIITGTMKETAKGEILGASIAPAQMLPNAAARLAAEIGIFATVGPLLEGEAPSVKSFVDAAVQIGTLKIASGIPSETARWIGKMREGAQLGEQPKSLKQLQYQMEAVGLPRKQAEANAALVRAGAKYHSMDVDEFVRNKFAGFTMEGNILPTDYLKQYRGNVVKDFERMAAGKKKKGKETLDDSAKEKNKREFAEYFLEHPAAEDTNREMELAKDYYTRMLGQAAGANAIRLNDKTIFSVDVSSNCPFGEMGHSCIMCYVDLPRAWVLSTMKAAAKKHSSYFGGRFMDQMMDPDGLVSVKRSATGEWEKIGTMTDVKKIITEIRKKDKSIKGLPRNANAMFNNAPFDETYISEMPKLWVEYLNSMGGMRVFSTGDFRGVDIPTLDKIVAAAKARGLDLKFITKQKECIERYGNETNCTFNVSAQFDPDLLYTHAKPAYKKLTKILGYKPKKAEAAIVSGTAFLKKAGFFSQGFSKDEIIALQDKYGFEKIKGRYVSMNQDEYIRAVATKAYGVVTRYHGFVEPSLMKSLWRSSNRFKSYYEGPNAPFTKGPSGQMNEDFVASIFENVKDSKLPKITQRDLDHVCGKDNVKLEEFRKWVDAKTCCVGGTCGGCLVGCAKSQTEAMGFFKMYSDGTPLAAVQFLADGRALIKVMESPANVATVAHELAHVFRRILDLQDLQTAGKWAGAIDGVWSRETEENFSNGYEKFLASGEAPTPQMARIFELFRNWMKEVYGEIGSMQGKELTPEMKAVFDKLTGKPKARRIAAARVEVRKPTPEEQADKDAELRDAVSSETITPEKKQDLFNQTAQYQRGAPEQAMIRIQDAEAGMFSYVAENIGDISHRISQQVNSFDGGYAVPKIRLALSSLKDKYGFEREVNEQIDENIKYRKKNKNIDETHDQRLKKLKDLAQEYANEHRRVPVFNRAQFLAREAAVAYGEWRFNDAIKVLEELQSEVDKGVDSYKKFVHEYDPKYYTDDKYGTHAEKKVEHKIAPKLPKNGGEIDGLPGYTYVELPKSEMRKLAPGIEDEVSNWGTLDRKAKKVYIRSDLSPKQKFQTLLHEKYHEKYYESKGNFDVAAEIMRSILNHHKKKSTAQEIEAEGKVLPETVEQFSKSMLTGKVTDNPVLLSYIEKGVDAGHVLMQEAYVMEMSNRELRGFDLQMFASETASPDAPPPVGKYDNTPKMQLGRKILEEVLGSSNVPDIAKENGYKVGPVYRYIPSNSLEPFFSESKSGIWFADSEQAAINFGKFKVGETAEGSFQKGVVLKAYLSIKKPEGFGSFWGREEGGWDTEVMRKKVKEADKKRPRDTYEAMRREAERRGADAFIIGKSQETDWLWAARDENVATGRQFVVFEPRQILWEDNPNVDFGGKAVVIPRIPAEDLSMPTMEWSNIDTRPLLDQGPIDWKKWKEKYPWADVGDVNKEKKSETLARAKEVNLRKAIQKEAEKRGLSYDEINAISSEESVDLVLDNVMKDISELGTNEVSQATKQHLDAILNVPAQLGRMLALLNVNKEKRRLARKIATLVKQGRIPEHNKEQIVDIAMKIKKGEATTDEIRAVANNIGSPEVWRYLSSLWINNILSGPGTQIVNIVSNTAMYGVNIPHKALRGAVDAVLSAVVSDRERQFYVDEALPTWASVKRGAKGAKKAFKEVWAKGFSEDYASKFEDKQGVYRGVWQNKEITPENWEIFTKSFFGVKIPVPEGLKGKRYYPLDKDLLNLWRVARGREAAAPLAQYLNETEIDKITGREQRKLRYKVSVGTVVEAPTMALAGTDVMFKSMIYETEKSTIAMRVVRNAVKRGDISLERAEELYDALISNPTKEMREEAFKKSNDAFGLIGEDKLTLFEDLGYGTQSEAVAVAKKLTFTDPPGEITKSINHIIDLLPYGAGRYIVPFTNIATQLLRRGIEYLPGVGAVSMRKAGEKSAEIIAKQIEGLIFTTAILTMNDMGIITGKPPESQAERDALYATGWKPYAVKIGGVYYQWNRIEPFKIAAAMILAVAEQFGKDDDEKTFTEKFMGAAKQFGEAYVDSHYLKGLQDLLGRYGAWESWVQRFAASWVPYSGMWRFVNRGLEGWEKGAASVKQSRTFKDSFAQTIPGGYKWARPKLNALGEEQFIEGGSLRQMIPFKAGGEKHHLIYETLLETDYFPGRVPRTVQYRGKKYELDEDEVLKYQRIAGANIYDRLERIIERPGFHRLTKEQQKKLLNKVTMKARSRARANFVKDFLYDRAVEELKK